jgi:putative endonuclease
MPGNYVVYILASGRNGTLYVGVTNDITRRVWEHKAKEVRGFTARYGVDQLMWFEEHGDIGEAIYREKQIKKWKRAWKIELFRDSNPDWHDLYPTLTQGIW